MKKVNDGKRRKLSQRMGKEGGERSVKETFINIHLMWLRVFWSHTQRERKRLRNRIMIEYIIDKERNSRSLQVNLCRE